MKKVLLTLTLNHKRPIYFPFKLQNATSINNLIETLDPIISEQILFLHRIFDSNHKKSFLYSSNTMGNQLEWIAEENQGNQKGKSKRIQQFITDDRNNLNGVAKNEIQTLRKSPLFKINMEQNINQKIALNNMGFIHKDALQKAKNIEGAIQKTFPNGSQFQGQVNQHNQAHGFGVFTASDASYYVGQWTNNKAYGKGKYVNSKAQMYEGDWRNDIPFGIGQMKLTDGSSYSGYFVEGYKHGQGKYIWPDKKTFYKGQWNMDVIQGRGELSLADNRKYWGDFKDNMFHGNGVYIWADGCKYVGEFSFNKKHGSGTYEWTDGRVFKGSWSRGLRQGQGTVITKDGTERKGIWRSDKRLRWIQ